MKGMHHYLREAWKKPDRVYKDRLVEWRKGNVVERVEKPLRLDRAHALGYKAKPGFIMARVMINRGGRKRPHRMGHGRRTKRQTIRLTLKMNYRWVAEQRVQRKFPNLEVLNSYWIGQDGKHYFYEVILVNPETPEIKSDRQINWILRKENRGRVFRGLTSAAKKSRGLRNKGKRAIKVRPSLRAHNRQGK